jgi:F0F1-type ATP synthase membrane subunit c/vacuolar-type H+-ATPase subunit K
MAAEAFVKSVSENRKMDSSVRFPMFFVCV